MSIQSLQTLPRAMASRLLHLPIRRPRVVLLALVPVLLVAGWIASHLGMNSRMDAMLPADAPSMRAQAEFDRAFDAQDQALLVVQGADPARVRPYLDAAAAAIREAGLAHGVLYRVGMPGAPSPRYLESDRGGTWLMILTPRLDRARYAESAQAFLGGLERITARLAAEPRFAGVTVGITGGALIQDVEADRRAMGSLFCSAGVTLALVLAFIILAFRRLLLPLSMVIPLMSGLVLTLAFATVTYGALNMFSVGFAAILFGLGIDFAVHLLNRFHEERDRGAPPAEAIQTALVRSGAGIAIGAATTALAFFAFLPARFRAFAQVGGLAGAGILLMCLTMLVLVPALVAVSPSQAARPVRGHAWGFLRRLGALAARRRGVVIALTLVAAAALAPGAWRARLDRDLSQVYPDDLASVRWLRVVEREFGWTPHTLTFRVKDAAEARRVTASLLARPDVKEVKSILSHLPADVAASPVAASLVLAALPRELTDLYIGRDGSYLMELVPAVDLWQPAAYERLRQAIADATGHGPVGMPALMADIGRLIEADVPIICATCLGLSFLLLLFFLRGARPALTALLPVGLSLVITLGLMPLLGLPLNVFSIMAFPLIIGIGVDGGIHLVHRLRTDSGDPADLVMHTGKAMIVTTGTTVIGFGSLMTIRHPGLQSLGATVSLGLSLCLLFSLLLIPALFPPPRVG